MPRIPLPTIRTIPIALAVSVLVLSAAPAAGQVVRGRVLDAATGQPVGEATVTATDPQGRRAARGRTGADGVFVLELRRGGQLRIGAERIGYRASLSGAVLVGARDTLEVDLRLATGDLTLEPLTVRARIEPPRVRALAATGFYEREVAGFGHFIRREDIDKRPGVRTFDLVRAAPGVRTIKLRGGVTALLMRGEDSINRDGCTPRVFLDGMPAVAGTEEEMNDLLDAEQVEAIEIYRGPAELPAQYAGAMASCGAILIWTRR